MNHTDRLPAARLAKGGSMTDWQPIKIAPLDRKLIVYGMTSVSGGPRTLLARYWPAHTLEVAEGYEHEAEGVVIADDGTAYLPANWYEENSADDAPAVTVYPTHWMPLPGAPSDD